MPHMLHSLCLRLAFLDVGEEIYCIVVESVCFYHESGLCHGWMAI